MKNFIIIIAFLLIGIVLKRIPAIPPKTGNALNLFVIYISLPALVLLKIPNVVFTADLLVPALMPWGMLLFSSVLILIFSKFFKWDRATTGCLMLIIPLGNTSFLGIPMVQTFFGENAVPYALLYDQFGSFLALATYGSFIIALYGTGKNKPTLVTVLKKIVSFPPFVALVLAVILKILPYPPVLVNLLDILASTLIPLVMIAVGFQLTLRLSKKVTSPLSVGLFIKLIAAPLTALFFCKIAGLEGESVRVSIFEAGMPPMVSAGALAILANLSPTLTAAAVGIGIVLSFITLPLLYQLL